MRDYAISYAAGNKAFVTPRLKAYLFTRTITNKNALIYIIHNMAAVPLFVR